MTARSRKTPRTRSRKRPQPLAVAPTAPVPAQQHAHRVLVVEDHPDLQRLLLRELAVLRSQLTMTGSYREAWNALVKGEYCLVLTDVTIPMTQEDPAEPEVGIGLIRYLRRAYTEAEMALVAMSLGSYAERTLAAGADTFRDKVDMQGLVAEVEARLSTCTRCAGGAA